MSEKPPSPFASESLARDIEVAFGAFEGVLGDPIGHVLDGGVPDPRAPTTWEGHEIGSVSADSCLEITLPRSDTYSITFGRFIHLCQELKTLALQKGASCTVGKRLVVKLEVQYTSANWAQLTRFFASLGPDGRALEATAKVSQRDYCAYLSIGRLEWALCVMKSDLGWDKLNPPYNDDDVYCVVESLAERIDVADAWAVFEAYRFQLDSRRNISVDCANRLTHEDLDPGDAGDSATADLVEMAKPLGSLPSGRGVIELLNLFNDAQQDRPQIAILAYARVLEYVSATHLKLQLLQRVRRRLQSDTTGRFPTELLLSLVPEFDEYRKRDRDAVVAVIKDTADAVSLARLAPGALGKLRNLPAIASAKDRSEALAELGICMVATRNMHAHAKPDYRPTGEECPAEQLDALAACAKLAAQQAILWYCEQHEDLRVC